MTDKKKIPDMKKAIIGIDWAKDKLPTIRGQQKAIELAILSSSGEVKGSDAQVMAKKIIALTEAVIDEHIKDVENQSSYTAEVIKATLKSLKGDE